MEITEVRVKLVATHHEKLRAFCSITIDECFVVRDLRIIEGSKGPFVAMPSRKLTLRCSRCGGKNPYRASYCGDCGSRLPVRGGSQDLQERTKLHADIAHPINSRCRELIQKQVLEGYAAELVRASDPGYRPAALDAFDEDYLDTEAPETVDERRAEVVPDRAEDGGRGRERGPPGAAAPTSEPVGARFDLDLDLDLDERDGPSDHSTDPVSADGMGRPPGREPAGLERSGRDWNRGERTGPRQGDRPFGGQGPRREGARERPREGQGPGQQRFRGGGRRGGQGRGDVRRDSDRGRPGGERSVGDRPLRSQGSPSWRGSEGPVERSEGSRAWDPPDRPSGARPQRGDDIVPSVARGEREPSDRDAFGFGVEDAGASSPAASDRRPAATRSDPERPREDPEHFARDRLPGKPAEHRIHKDLDEPEDNFGAGIFS